MPTPHTINADTVERFWSKAKIDADCWLWIAAKNSKGYGKFLLNRVDTGAHRVAWLLTYGSIPPGKHVLHTCDTPACVNPKHLYIGTNRDNVNDRTERGRGATGTKPATCKLSEAQVLTIRNELVNGATYSVLARKYGVSPPTIQNIAKGKSWRHLGPAPISVATYDRGAANRGNRSIHAKLRESQVVEARRRHAAGESVASITRDMPADYQTVWNAVKRKSWRHLP